MKPFEFKYKIYVEKSYKLKSFNCPGFYSSESEAEKDISFAFQSLKLEDKLKDGMNEIIFDVLYIPDRKNGYYVPNFHSLNIKHYEDNDLRFDYQLKIQRSWFFNLWYRLFKKIIKRD